MTVPPLKKQSAASVRTHEDLTTDWPRSLPLTTIRRWRIQEPFYGAVKLQRTLTTKWKNRYSYSSPSRQHSMRRRTYQNDDHETNDEDRSLRGSRHVSRRLPMNLRCKWIREHGQQTTSAHTAHIIPVLTVPVKTQSGHESMKTITLLTRTTCHASNCLKHRFVNETSSTLSIV